MSSAPWLMKAPIARLATWTDFNSVTYPKSMNYSYRAGQCKHPRQYCMYDPKHESPVWSALWPGRRTTGRACSCDCSGSCSPKRTMSGFTELSHCLSSVKARRFAHGFRAWKSHYNQSQEPYGPRSSIFTFSCEGCIALLFHGGFRFAFFTFLFVGLVAAVRAGQDGRRAPASLSSVTCVLACIGSEVYHEPDAVGIIL